MEHFVVARSRNGWCVALGGDVLREVSNVEEARSYAEEVRDTFRDRGVEAEVVDLSEAGPNVVFIARDL